jgi:trans-aconitate methyltransferase
MDKTKMAVDVFNKRAGIYQDKFMDTGLYHDTFDLFCRNIKKENACILDIACGPGNITKYLLSKRPDFKILGIDLAPNMIALAAINNPSAEFQIMDCRDISTTGKKYDAIMCGFCLPYLSKEETEQLIKDVSALLNTNGVFYISTMEGDHSKSALKTSSSGDQIYQHFHEAGYLVKALEENGFIIIDLRRKVYQGNDGATITDLVIIAGK